MIKMIKELLKDDKLVQERMKDKEKNDKDLIKYINDQAKKHLKSKNGGIEDEIVVGWAKHYYIEKNSDIEFFKKPVVIKLSKEEQKKKDEESHKKHLELAKTNELKRKEKEKKLAAKIKKLKKELEVKQANDPFCTYTLDEKSLKIIRHEPKKTDKNQMGLFDL